MNHVTRTLMFVALATVPGVAQDSKKPGHEAIKKAMHGLFEAQAGKDVAAKVAAIRAAAAVDTDEVAKQIGRSLKDKEFDAREAALTALRYMKSKAALDALLRAKTRLTKDVELEENYLLALGQHANVKALPALIYRAADYRERKLLATRVAAIAHIRSIKSLEALIDIENKTSRRRGNRSQVVSGIELLVGVPYPKKKARGGPEVAQWWQMVRAVKTVEPEPHGLSEREMARYKRRWAEPGSEKEPRRKRRARKNPDDGKK